MRARVATETSGGVVDYREETWTDNRMISIPEKDLLALPIDCVALQVLQDLTAESDAYNEINYLRLLTEKNRYSTAAAHVVSEALGWLRAATLIARPPGDSGFGLFVTRAGHRVAREGLEGHIAAQRIQGELHPLIAEKARSQFLLGEYGLAVFASMRAVEIRVREMCGFGDDAHGTKLMSRAFGKGGPLRDPEALEGESDAVRHLFAGAYGLLRNREGHREVDYDDVNEAAECVQTASLLMRILDRVEKRPIQSRET